MVNVTSDLANQVAVKGCSEGIALKAMMNTSHLALDEEDTNEFDSNK